METKFNVGDILTDKNTSTRYRIICIKSNQVVLCGRERTQSSASGGT